MISWCGEWKPVKESEFDFEMIKRHWNYILNITNDILSEDRTILKNCSKRTNIKTALISRFQRILAILYKIYKVHINF